jgi:hypothetical protein
MLGQDKDCFARNFDEFIKDLKEREGRIEDKYQNEILSSYALFSPLGPIKYKSALGHLINTKENALFEIIEKEGPYILCNPDVQDKLSEWLSDKDHAFSRMTAIRDALLAHANLSPRLKRKTKSIASKPGRPESSVISKWGAEKIKRAYKKIIVILRMVKTDFKDDPQSITKLCDYYLWCTEEELAPYWEKVAQKKRSKLDEIEEFSECGQAILTNLSCVSLLLGLQFDAQFNKAFKKFNWSPFELAQQIIAKNLNLSMSKTYKILHSR